MITINLQNSLLDPVIYRPSPHCDERPEHTNINMIVVHNISLPPGKFGSRTIEDFFCGKLDASQHPYLETIAHLRVSSHLLIQRDGTIIQFVPFSKRAWHAGESYFAGQTHCNDFSIGIELEGTDDQPFEEAQYTSLNKVVRSLTECYPNITQDRIVGHSDIAPGRKTDPGPMFDWSLLKGK